MQERVLRVVSEEAKAAVEARAIAHRKHVVRIGVANECGDRRVNISGEEDHQHVVNEIVHVEQVLVGRIGCAVRVQSLDLEIVGVVGKPVGRRHPQTGPGAHVAVGGENRVAGARVHLDNIIILFVAAKIACAVRGFGPLGGVVKAPILPVDVKMVKIPSLGRLALGVLGVARELVAQTDEPVVPFETPRVIFKRSQVIAVERVHAALVGECRKLQLRRAVFRAEKEAKRVFGIARAAAVAATNADAGVDLKTFRAVGINQFNRRGPFPGDAVLARVRINARGRVEQIRRFGHDGIGRDRFEVVDDFAAVSRIIHHVRVHAVVHHVRAPTVRPARRRLAVRRLANNIVQENIRLGIDARRFEAVLERRGANDRGAAD